MDTLHQKSASGILHLASYHTRILSEMGQMETGDQKEKKSQNHDKIMKNSTN